MTSHSIYKFSWKNITSICIQLKKKSRFHDAPSEKVWPFASSPHSGAFLFRPQGTHSIEPIPFTDKMFEDQYFSGIQSCTTLSSGFWGKIISTVLEVFCLSWAITVRRDARDSSEALTIKSLRAVISKLRILDCWCFEQQLVQHYESNNRNQKKLKSNLKKTYFLKPDPNLTRDSNLTWARTCLVLRVNSCHLASDYLSPFQGWTFCCHSKSISMA